MKSNVFDITYKHNYVAELKLVNVDMHGCVYKASRALINIVYPMVDKVNKCVNRGCLAEFDGCRIK